MIQLWADARKIKCGDDGYVAPADDPEATPPADGTIAINEDARVWYYNI